MLYPEAIQGEKWLPHSRQLMSLVKLVAIHLLFVNDVLTGALRALHLLFLGVDRGMARKQLNCKVFVLFSLLRRKFGKPLQLYERFRALPVTLIEEAGQSN